MVAVALHSCVGHLLLFLVCVTTVGVFCLCSRLMVVAILYVGVVPTDLILILCGSFFNVDCVVQQERG